MIANIARCGLVVTLSLSCVTTISAQEYPHKIIRVMVPYPQGSYNDGIMRILSQRLAVQFGQQFVIANRIAAGGGTAASTIVEESPDGYTWLFTSVNHVADVALYSKLPYNVERDFATISLIGNVPVVLIANSAIGIRTTKDLIEAAKARPRSLKFGSPGVGTGEHLAMEMLKRAAGIELLHAPYKETLPALAGVAEGRSHVIFANIPQTLTFIKDGRLIPLAVSRSTRSPMLPATPTLREIGVLKSGLQIWFGLLTRSGVPRHILRRISSEVVRLVREPTMMASLAEVGIDAIGAAPEEFDQTIRRDLMYLTRLMREAGIEAKP